MFTRGRRNTHKIGLSEEIVNRQSEMFYVKFHRMQKKTASEYAFFLKGNRDVIVKLLLFFIMSDNNIIMVCLIRKHFR